MLKKTSVGFLSLSALTVPCDGIAHHSAAPHFDLDTKIEVEGVVTRLALVNPHAYVYFDVSENGATDEWRCELRAGTILERADWDEDTLSPGSVIRIVGSPARREANVCKTDTISLDGGDAVDVMQVGRVYPSGADSDVRISASTDVPAAADFLENGQPNISGFWVATSRNSNGRAQWPQTEAGIEASNQWDYRFDFAELRCEGSNIFETLYHDRHINEFTQYDDRIVLQYGFMDVARVVYLDQDAHPEDVEPSMQGHSIGRWEGQTLVVDTIGFAQGALIPPREILHSAEMHSVERFTLNDDGTMSWDFAAEDPFLQEPFAGGISLARSARPYEPYECVELSGDNNVRPTNP
ncbi:MAG: DUF6152 family protein [Gammaproteobacteria bacterium]